MPLGNLPVGKIGKIAEKAVSKGVFLTTWHGIWVLN